MKKKKLPLPKYYTGGELLEDTGNIYKNAGLGTADAIMSTVGLSNVVKDDDYSGAGSKFAKGYSNVIGGIGKAALPMAANVIAPGSGKAVSAAQGAIGQYNPQNVDEFGNPIVADTNTQKMNGIASVANAAIPMMMRNGGTMQYMNGGMNAEVEKQENTLNPDGSTNQYNGPSHEGGGIKTSLEPGTMIFSDRLKLGGKTFADLNKANNTVKEDKMLEESKSARVRLTAELMKSAKNKNSEKLFEEQEALKQSKLTNYAKRIGMSPDGKYSNGGKVTPAQWDAQNTQKGWQVDPRMDYTKTQGTAVYKQYVDPAYKFTQDPNATSKWNIQGPGVDAFGTMPGNAVATYEQPVRQSSFETQPTPKWIPAEQTTYQGKPAGSFRSSTDADPNSRYVFAGGQYIKMSNGDRMPKYEGGGYGPNYQALDYTDPSSRNIVDRNREMGMPDNRIDAMSNTPMMDDTNGGSPNWAGIATQVGLGLANNVGNIYDLSRANKTETTTYNRMTPKQLDPTAALRYNDVQSRAYNEQLRNSSNGNSSTYIQNRKDAAINQMYANDQIRQQYANTNAGIQNQAGYYNAQTGDRESDANAMNRAAGRNIKSNAYANIGQNIMGQYGDYKRGQNDQDMLEMYGTMYPENKYNPAYQNYRDKRSRRSGFTA